jgi:hypothetical protein
MFNLFPETIAKKIEGHCLIDHAVFNTIGGTRACGEHTFINSYYNYQCYSINKSCRRAVHYKKCSAPSFQFWCDVSLTVASANALYFTVYVFDSDDVVISIVYPLVFSKLASYTFLDNAFYITKLNAAISGLPVPFICVVRHDLKALGQWVLNGRDDMAIYRIRLDAQNRVRIAHVESLHDD